MGVRGPPGPLSPTGARRTRCPRSTATTGVRASSSSQPDGSSRRRVPASETGRGASVAAGCPPDGLCTFTLRLPSPPAPVPQRDNGTCRALGVISGAPGSAHPAGPGGSSADESRTIRLLSSFGNPPASRVVGRKTGFRPLAGSARDTKRIQRQKQPLGPHCSCFVSSQTPVVSVDVGLASQGTEGCLKAQQLPWGAPREGLWGGKCGSGHTLGQAASGLRVTGTE